MLSPKTSNALSITQLVLTVVLGIFGNQLSTLWQLPTYWLICFFVLLLLSLVAIQVFALKARTSLPENTGETRSSAPIKSKERKFRQVLLSPNTVFPAGILLGVVTALPVYLLFPDEKSTSIMGIGSGHKYEIISALLGICFCTGYRFLIGLKGLSFFAIGLGLGNAGIILALSPSTNDALETFYSHPSVLLAVALTLRFNTKRWGYVFSIPIAIGSFYFLPRIALWIWILTSSPYDGSHQSGNSEFYAPGHHTVYYEIPFRRTPQLTVRLNGISPDSTRLRVVYQDSACFEVDIESNFYPVPIWFEADGKTNEK
jgi:hypothetical protein